VTASLTLTAPAGTRTLAGWGIEPATITRRSFAADLFEFTIATEDALGAPVFNYGDAITLKRDGVPVFIGKIIREQALGGGTDEEAHGYVAANAWHDLERLVYQQPHCLANGAFSGFVETLMPLAVLGQTDLGGSYLTTTAQMQAVVNYALTKGVELLDGGLVGGVPFAREEVQSLTCAEVLRRLGALTPDAAMWVEYSTGAQVLRFGRRADLTAIGYNLTAGNAVVEWRCEKRADLVPSGVRFIFRTSEVNSGGDEPENADGRTYTRATVQEAGLPDLPGGLIAAVEQHGVGTDSQAPIPGNLAAEYYLSLQTPHYEGQIVTRGADVRGDLRPGHVLNLTNGRADWATMRAVVQQTQENLTTGETLVEFGPPEQLPAQDFVDQLMFIRRVRPQTNLQAVRTCRVDGPDIDDDGEVPDTGEEEADNPDRGVDPESYNDEERLKNSARKAATDGSGEGYGTIDIEVCQNGSAQTVRVLGTIV